MEPFFLWHLHHCLTGKNILQKKRGYAFRGLIICDDMARITNIDLGWPGSVHDNRVWSNSDDFIKSSK